jgi:hypothetical protein
MQPRGGAAKVELVGEYHEVTELAEFHGQACD